MDLPHSLERAKNWAKNADSICLAEKYWIQYKVQKQQIVSDEPAEGSRQAVQMNSVFSPLWYHSC